MTIGSLLASAIDLPALIAASVGSRPAPPTIAEITRSAFGIVAVCTRPSAPPRTLVGSPLHRTRSCWAAASSDIATMAGPKVRTCSSSLSTLVPAVIPITWNLPGNFETMSSVFVPIDPVEPKITSFFIRAGLLGSFDGKKVIVECGRRKDQAINPIHDPAMTRDQRPGVPYAGAAF